MNRLERVDLTKLDNKELQFAGAYNPLYLVRKKSVIQDNQLEQYASLDNAEFRLIELKGDMQPIGIHYIETDFTTHTIKLKGEDTFYIFSDGYVDQFGGENRKKFKSLNFKQLLLSVQGETMEKQKEQIDNTFETWRGHHDQIDDVCIIGVKV